MRMYGVPASLQEKNVWECMVCPPVSRRMCGNVWCARQSPEECVGMYGVPASLQENVWECMVCPPVSRRRMCGNVWCARQSPGEECVGMYGVPASLQEKNVW